jgi:hypothetical protein
MIVTKSLLSVIVVAAYKASKSFCEVVVEELKNIA